MEEGKAVDSLKAYSLNV